MKKKGRNLIFLGLCVFIIMNIAFIYRKWQTVPIELTWYYVSEEQGAQRHIEWVADRFRSKYPQIRLKLKKLPSENGPEFLSSLIASDRAPDVFYISGYSTIRDYEASGHLYNLNGQPFLENLDKDFLEYGQIKGKQVVVTASYDVLGTVYNKEIFGRYGLEIPKTYSELIALCDKLLDLGIIPFATGLKTGWTAEAFLMNFAEIQCAGKDDQWYSDKMKLQSQFCNDTEFKDSFRLLYNLKPYFSDQSLETDWNSALELMLEGKTAMICGGSQAVDGILGKNPDMQLGIFATPVLEDEEEPRIVVIPAGGNVLFNSTDKRRIEAGLLLMNEIYSEEALEHEIKTANRFVALQETGDSSDALKDVERYIQSGQIFNRGNIETFTKEHTNIIRNELLKYLSYEREDADGFAESLDNAFNAEK